LLAQLRVNRGVGVHPALMPTTPMMIPKMGGKIPPPTKSIAMEIRIMTSPPFFR
jgi:hypothetical protein